MGLGNILTWGVASFYNSNEVWTEQHDSIPGIGRAYRSIIGKRHVGRATAPGSSLK